MYTKRLYAFLKQFRNTGYRRVSVERFREYMDATSKTYDDFAQLRRRVITPAVNELIEKKIFPDLKVKEEKSKNGKRVAGLSLKF